VFKPFFIAGANPPRIIYQAWTNDSTPPDLVPGVGGVMIAQDLGTGAPRRDRRTTSARVTPGGSAEQRRRLRHRHGPRRRRHDGTARLAASRVRRRRYFSEHAIEVTRGVSIAWSRIVRRGPDAVIASYGYPRRCTSPAFSHDDRRRALMERALPD
jgi:hypothetical protein